MPKVPEPLVLHSRPPPWLRITLAALLVAALLGGGWALFDYGRARAGFDAAAAARTRSQLMERILQLKKTNDGLRERLALLQRSGQVDREAYGRVRASLQRLQDETLELKQKLAFYRSVVGPHPGGPGLQVRSFTVRSAGGNRAYRYELILSRVRSRGSEARGTVRVLVDGVQGGVSRQLKVTAPGGSGGRTVMRYRFKYFQRLQGRVQLPPGFRPRSVRVELHPDGRHRRVIEKTFQWSQAVGGTGDVG